MLFTNINHNKVVNDSSKNNKKLAKSKKLDFRKDYI